MSKRKRKHKLQKTKRPSVQMRGVALRRTQFSGPLPPPQTLAEFDQVVPGAAERIIAMAEKQSNHRISMESRVIKSDVFNSKAGIICGFIIALAFLGAAVFLTIKGYPVTGAVIAGIDIVSLVSIFIYGSKQRREERNERRK